MGISLAGLLKDFSLLEISPNITFGFDYCESNTFTEF